MFAPLDLDSEKLATGLFVNIYWKDKAGHDVGCNDQMLRSFGGSSKYEFVGKPLEQIDRQVLLRNQEVTLIEKGCTQEGKPTEYLTKKIPIQDHEGKSIGLLVVSIDLSFHNQYERIFQQQAQNATLQVDRLNVYLNNILENIPENIYWMDREGCILGCNEKQAKVFGLNSPSELIGKNIFDVARLLHWDEKIPRDIRQHDIEVMRTKQTKVVEETVILDGQEKIYLAYKSPLCDKFGTVIGIIGVAVDITERINAEQREKQALAETAALHVKAEAEKDYRRAVMVLAGSIAHDLRTPLATVGLAANGICQILPVLMEAYQKTQEADIALSKRLLPFQAAQLHSMGENIKKTVDDMNLFITETLKMLSRMVTNHLSEEDFKTCVIKECIQNTLSNYPFENEEEKLIEWTGSYSFYFLGNPILFTRVLCNLINNALYQIHKEGKGKITLSTEEQSEYNVLRFRDTAGGMSPEAVSALFQDYQSTKEKGTGIGLALCKIIMQSFGGDITAHSIEGHSTEFLLFFPKQQIV